MAEITAKSTKPVSKTAQRAALMRGGATYAEAQEAITIGRGEEALAEQQTAGEVATTQDTVAQVTETAEPVISTEAAKALATEYQISESEATRLAKLSVVSPDAAELRTLTPQQIATLQAAAKAYSPYAVAPESVATGEPLPVSGAPERTIVYAETPEKQAKKVESQRKAAQTLTSRGLLSAEGTIASKAFTSKDKAVRQALYDVGLSGKEVSEQADWMNKFTRGQAAAGYTPSRISEQIEEIQSGKYKAYSPETKEFENVYREVVEQREVAGLIPKELDEIHSGKYKIPDISTGGLANVTEAQYKSWQKAGEPTSVQMAMQSDVWRGFTPSEQVEIRSGKYTVPDAAGKKVPTTKEQASKYDQAVTQLEWAHISGNLYRLPDILVSDDPKDRQAAEVIFDSQSIHRGELWVGKHWGPTERGGFIFKPSTTVSELWRGVTPWKEEKGQTFWMEAAKLRDKAKGMLSPGMLAALTPVGIVASAEPTLVGEAFMAALIAGGLVYGAVKLRNVQQVEKKATESLESFYAANGRPMTTADVIIADNQGNVATLADVLNITPLPAGTKGLLDIPDIRGVEQAIPLEELIPLSDVLSGALLTIPDLTPARVDTPKEKIEVMPDIIRGLSKIPPQYREPIVHIPGIGDLPKELNQAERMQYGKHTAQDLITKASELRRVEEKVKSRVRTIGSEEMGLSEADYDRFLKTRVSETLRKPTRVSEDAWASINSALIRGADAEIVRKARENDARVQALVRDALAKHGELELYRSYISTYDALGKAVVDVQNTTQGNPSRLYALMMYLAQTYGLSKPVKGQSLLDYLSQTARTPLEARVFENLIDTYTKSRTIGKSETVAANAALASTMAMLNEYAQTESLTQTQVQALTQPMELIQPVAATSTAVQPAVATSVAVSPAVRTATVARTATLTRALTTPAAIATPVIPAVATGIIAPPVKIPIIKLSGDKGAREKKIPAGSIAFKQGIFWKYIPPPYDQPKPITLPKGVSPTGADTSGGNSPYTTVQRIGGSGSAIPEKIAIDLGVTDAFITNSGGKISFSGSGEETNVGERIDSPTKGMTVGHAYAGDNASRQVRGISRPDMDTEAPARKKKKEAFVKDEELPGVLQAGFGDERYFDEDPNWLREPVSRAKMSKKRPPRKGNTNSSGSTNTMGGIRL